MGKPRIECVARRDIEAFARRERRDCPPDGVLPISESRARAWAANPHADAEDVVLLVARLEGRCAGYLGLLPGRIRIHEQIERVSWLSTLFVPEALRSQAIGGLLLMRAIALGRTLAASGSSDEAERAYRAVGFAPPREAGYFELDLLRARNWPALPLRAVRVALQRHGARVPRALDAAIAACGTLGASALLPALLAAARLGLGRWHARALDRLPDGVDRVRSDVHFVRDRALLEWMLAHPWASSSRAERDDRYFFDDYREQAFHRVYEVRADASSAAAGWVILWFDVQGDRRRLHVLDCELGPATAADALLAVALREALRLRANLIYVPELCGAALGRLGAAGKLFVPRLRRSFYRPHPSSRVKAVLEQLELHYADGDVGFA
jgi:hypothetical protein